MKLRHALLYLLLAFLAACSYTPIYTDTPIETRPPLFSEDEETSQHELPPTEETTNNDQPERVAIATPATINNNASTERRRDERSATDELRAQARLASKKGELDRAERLLNRALRIAPREPLSYYQLAEVKLQQQQPHNALQLARKGLSLQPVGLVARKLKDAEQRASDSIL